jgi:hypothetical protein
MPSASTQYQALYQATVREAASGGSLLMGKLVEAARTALQTREAASRDLRERDALTMSIKHLRSWESELCKRYPLALLAAFDNPAVAKKVAPSAGGGLQFDQLELMDEVQVLTSVALARTQQVTMLAAEVSLAELNTLICSTLGLTAVRPESNPLRPEVYIKALKDVVEQTQVSAATQLDWLGAMSVTLGQELRKLYEHLSGKLRMEGVVAAGYKVVQAPSGGGVGRGVAQDANEPALAQPAQALAGAPDAAARMAPPPAESVRERSADDALLTLDKLRRLLAGELEPEQAPVNRVQNFAEQFARDFESGPHAMDVPATEFDATMPAALEALTEMKQVDRVVQNLEARRAAPAAPTADNSVAGVRQSLRRGAKGMAQALSLEVVTLMVDNIAHDSRLLPPVQELVRSLEPALLRLSLVDPRFFTDKQHPARVLLQEITHRSLAYVTVEAPGFDGFLRHLKLTLEPLVSADIQGAELFVEVLAQLQIAWMQADERKTQGRQEAVEVLKHAEARNLLAEKIAREIDAHPDASRVPAVVIDFLCGPWAQVVAQARIAGGAGSSVADKYQALISALLWSAHPDLARKNVSKLTRLVPLLLNTLRDGLESIRYPATKTSAFLEALMGLHQLAFRGVVPAPTDAAPSTGARARRLEGGDPWVAPEEAQASNFIELPDVPQQPAAADVDVPVDIALGDLPLGSWVELLVNDQWVRTQLTWASPHGTLFLFTSVFGTTQSMTRRSRDKLVEAGKLRVISGQVVEGALNAVAQIAMRNSVDTSL